MPTPRRKRGLKVCVVERDAACVGASIRNFGFITVTGQGAGDTWRRARRAREVWGEVAPAAGIATVHQGLWLSAFRPRAMAVLQEFMGTEMAEGCELLDVDEAARRAPSLQLDGAQGVLYSPHEMRVESRTAIGLLARWLAEALGVTFRFGEAVLEVADAARAHLARRAACRARGGVHQHRHQRPLRRAPDGRTSCSCACCTCCACSPSRASSCRVR